MFTREFYIPVKARKIEREGVNAECYVYETERGEPAALGFRGKRSKPDFHFIYRNAEKRDKAVEGHFESVAHAAKVKAERMAERTVAPPEDTVKIGTIFANSWGYDQTNVDFYEVVQVSPSRKSVKLREIAADSVAGSKGYMSDQVKPAPGEFIGDPISKRVQMVSGEPWISFDHGASRVIGPDSNTYRSWYA